jgi:hypothetical protein
MNIFISAILSEEYSNLIAADVLASWKYLAERGYEVEGILGCGFVQCSSACKKYQELKKSSNQIDLH